MFDAAARDRGGAVADPPRRWRRRPRRRRAIDANVRRGALAPPVAGVVTWPLRPSRAIDVRVRGRVERDGRSPISSGSAPAARRNGWCGPPMSTIWPRSCARSTRRCRCCRSGVGSNLIVRDGGVPGVVVRLPKAMAKVRGRGRHASARAAAAMGITRRQRRARCGDRGARIPARRFPARSAVRCG